jgi:hypothetical protein
MLNKKILIANISSAFVGIVFGVLSNYSILLGLWFNLVIWGVVGILIGLFIEDNTYVRWSGIFYGLFLTLSFLISGFKGTPDHIIGFAVLSLILSVIGAFCGWCLVFAAHWVKRRFVKNS